MKNKKTVGLILCLLLAVSANAQYAPLKVKLNVLERFVVETLLPKEASFADWKILGDLREQLALTEEERAKVDLKPTPDGGMTGKWDAVPEKEITFGEITERMIKDALRELDRQGKLLAEHISVYEKFVLREQ